MDSFSVDLTNCDKEPIHILGKIQAYGCLLGIHTKTRTVTYVSKNCDKLFGVKAEDMLDKTIEECLVAAGEYVQQEITRFVNDFSVDRHQKNYEIKLQDKLYYAIISQSGETLVAEFEPADKTVIINDRVYDGVSKIIASNATDKLLDSAVKEIKSIISYDRVMVYRFLNDGSGKVVAEVKEEHLEPFLGLHYPESDIPKQARELYKINKIRLIADVDTEDVPVLRTEKSITLDMTHCVQRAVSPMHIRYLKNMGVHSSFSISIIINDKLWGLIACHNYTPKFIDYKIREAAKLISDIVSSFLFNKKRESNNLFAAKYNDIARKLQINLLKENTLVKALVQEKTTLLNATEAHGVALCLENNIHTLGSTPDTEQIDALKSWTIENISKPIFSTNKLIEYYAGTDGMLQSAAGVLIVKIGLDAQDMIIWFKPEYIHTVQWAGKPEKNIVARKEGNITLQDISPRTSFDVWTEVVKHTSEAWSEEEIESASNIVQVILETSHKKSKELLEINQKLQAAYDELDTFAYTVSHDLKTPLTVLKTYAEFLKHSQKDLKEDTKQIINNIIKGADNMSFMMNEILSLSRVVTKKPDEKPVNAGEIIQQIVHDLKIVSNNYNTDILIKDTPPVKGDHILIYQAFLNIIGNAIKYSSKADKPVVDITGYEHGGKIYYRITDNGIGIDPKDHGQVFELFKRMDNASSFEGTGVGLTIVKRIMDKHKGVVWFYSALNQGTTFYLIFNK